MRDDELRRMFRAYTDPVAAGTEPPDPRGIRQRGRRRLQRNAAGAGVALVLAVVAGGLVGGQAGPYRLGAARLVPRDGGGQWVEERAPGRGPAPQVLALGGAGGLAVRAVLPAEAAGP